MVVKAKGKETEILTVRLHRESKIAMTELAESMDRSKSYLAAEAVREFIDVRRRRIAEIRAGIKEANTGEFADPAKVDGFFKKNGESRNPLHSPIPHPWAAYGNSRRPARSKKKAPNIIEYWNNMIADGS